MYGKMRTIPIHGTAGAITGVAAVTIVVTVAVTVATIVLAGRIIPAARARRPTAGR
jgi:ABC-type antimicrobial peptide transport system permease subunit